MSLSDCVTKKIGQHFESPRKDFGFRMPPQGFTIEGLDIDGQKVDIRFDSGTPLGLHFWRFNLVIDILREAEGNFVMIGSRIEPKKSDTIEWWLYKKAIESGYPAARLRTAAFVCDILVLCEVAEYDLIRNEKTGRTVQAIRSIEIST